MEELTKKQKGFADDYLDSGNGVQSALKFDWKAHRKFLKSLNKDQKKILKDTLDKTHWTDKFKTVPEDFWSYVYIMRCGDYHKIGITENLDNRINQIQTGNPYPIELVFAVKHPKSSLIEKELHKKYSNKNWKREWFELQDGDFLDIKIFIDSYGK